MVHRSAFRLWPPMRGNEERMTQTEYEQKLDEVDRLLNDPSAPADPAKVWSLLAEIAQYNTIQGDIVEYSQEDRRHLRGGGNYGLAR
ncbi:MAG TPA: hypothetical protein VL614_22305 [Acetobacteraceae bacterium]|jgi:hypothetical protein|nr:hypothetical protein [Acetobacteraceae bacterium]